MNILNKESIKKVIKNPFLFVGLIILIILALGESFAVGCLIGSLISIPVALIGGDTNKTIAFFCHESSWKVSLMNRLSVFLGNYILPIIIISILVWAFLNFTSNGRKILSSLD